jgi:hypothetical protein
MCLSGRGLVCCYSVVCLSGSGLLEVFMCLNVVVLVVGSYMPFW